MKIFLYKFARLSVFVFILSIILVLICSLIKIEGVSLNQRLRSKYSVFVPGKAGFTLKRIRNIEDYKNIDILFCGSSHSYLGFDTNYFSSIGFRSFNLGTNAQTPLNTFFLLKKYIDRFSPRIIIYEFYPYILTLDGSESFTDIALNSNFSTDIIEMAFALKSLNAFKNLSDIYVARVGHPLDAVVQEESMGNRYIEGGYIESYSTRDINDPIPVESEIVPLTLQLDYVKKIIDFSKDNGSKILFVIHPFPSDFLKSIKNYNKLSRELKLFINKMGVDLIDFNNMLPLDPYLDFADDDHLNSLGAKKFNIELVDFMKNSIKYQFLFE